MKNWYLSTMRALWGFLAFIPLCWVWGVDGFGWFSIVGTIYFVPVYWIFDKVMIGEDGFKTSK